jgi:bifunctional DNase/RNase
MIFKDKKELEVLPIWLGGLEASSIIQASQLNPRDSSIHGASLKILDSFGIKVESVYFNEVSNNTQYAELSTALGDRKVKIRVKAQEALTLALLTPCIFQTNKDVVEKSRTLNFNYPLQGPGLHGPLPEKKDASLLH